LILRSSECGDDNAEKSDDHCKSDFNKYENVADEMSGTQKAAMNNGLLQENHAKDFRNQRNSIADATGACTKIKEII
jgi:hypothetical protein